MTTTKQTEIGTIESGVNYSYPMGIASVPFASFLKILKYSYDEGMSKVAKDQNDALGALEGSGLLKNVVDGLGDTAPVSYTHLTLPTICSV